MAIYMTLEAVSSRGLLATRLGDSKADDRASEHAAPTDPAAGARAAVRALGGKKFDHSARGAELSRKLADAGLALHPLEWILLSAGVAALVGGLALLRFGSPLAAAVGVGLGYVGAQMFLKLKVGRRRKRFDKQLGPTVLSISNAVKAGFGFAQAIDQTGRMAPEPIGAELRQVTRSVQLGLPMQDSLLAMATRNDSQDLRLLVQAVQIQSQTGGNLAVILDNIEFTIRERIRIRGEIQTLTGQARASGWILIVLPIALAGILSLIAPSYFTPMFKTGIGQGILGVSGFFMLCGYGLIRKIVNVKI